MVKQIIVMIVVFILAVAQGGWAQDGIKKLQQRIVERFFRTNVEVLREKLALSDEQEEQVQALFDETGKELMALHRAERNGEKVEEELNTLRKNKIEKLLVLLTKEQKAELDKLTRHRMKIGKEGRGKLFNPEFLNERLQLTEEQFVKLKEDILKGIHLDIKALREAYKGDRKKLHEELQLLLNEITEEIKLVLDERQRDLFDQLVKQMRQKKQKSTLPETTSGFLSL